MPEEFTFPKLDAATLHADLVQLLCRTARDKGRLEITNCDGETCVMISKEELDALEQAIEILSNTDGAKAMERTVEHFAIMAEQQSAAAG
ncbi:MAG TPA: hypothetical protein VHP11_04395 [Tepidisphaeraceae bacterium]|nr:hypothetical protein [Tepidisphaeraceae bacterium]